VVLAQVSDQAFTQVGGQPDGQESSQVSGRTWLLSATDRRPDSWEDFQMNEFGKPMTPFRKSSYSGAANVDCVQVGFVTAEVLMRDSKHPDGPVLHFTTDEWNAFVAGVKAGEFDLD
jgi:hypothetical protein